MKKFFCLIYILFTFGAIASETDPFTLRYTEVEDATKSINAEINRRIQAALSSSLFDNPSLLSRLMSRPCNYRRLGVVLGRELRRALYGKVEEAINNAEANIPVIYIPRSESIYANLSIFEAFPIYLGKMGLGNVIRIGEYLIGPDKFGHFFNEGYKYFNLRLGHLHSNNVKVTRGELADYVADMVAIHHAMEYGTSTETGIFGMATTGVKSYADMAANFNGLIFWSEVFNYPLAFRTLEEHRPYFECVDGRFTQIREFDLRDYFDAAFDEGINCSEYREGNVRDEVMARVDELERTHNRRFHCPVFPEKCPEVVEKYASFAGRIIHPTCLDAQ